MTVLIPLIEQIDAILPQTQCTKCGYQGCKPYAEAIATGDAINKCPPGGEAGIAKLATLLQQPVIPLDTTRGHEPEQLLVAFIREAECIGCTKCIQACPVDAILGAAKLMHTVISDICTGCELCVAPCPVDCIDMLPAAQQNPTPTAIQVKADLSRQRFNQRNARLQKQAEAKLARKQARAAFHEQNENAADARKLDIQAALAAARERTADISLAEQRSNLERTLAAAKERFERADAKVKQAEKKGLGQLEQLKARREDMRFKQEETEKKLAALLNNAEAKTSTHSAVEKILAARSKKSDAERMASGLAVIEEKLRHAKQQLATAEGEELIFIQEDIERLEKKRGQLLEEIK